MSQAIVKKSKKTMPRIARLVMAQPFKGSQIPPRGEKSKILSLTTARENARTFWQPVCHPTP
jgi:hypothetical protein